MTFIILVIAVIFFASTLSRAHHRIDLLEGRVNNLEKSVVKSSQVSPAQPSAQSHISQPVHINQSASVSSTAPVNAAVAPNAPTKPSAFDMFVAWLKDDWLMKLGAFLIVVAFVFFASYAVINNWIGPYGRITLTLLFGIVCMVAGYLRIKRFSHQGGILMVLGATIITLGVLAAREFYEYMFTPGVGLGIIFLSMLFLAIMSVVHKSKSLAFSSLVIAAITPFLLNVDFSFAVLFSYLFVIVIGTLWVVALTGFSELTLAALILYGFYSMPYLTSFATDERILMIMAAYVFAAIFFIVNITGILERSDKDTNIDFVIGIGNAALLMWWVMEKVSPEWQSLMVLLWAFVFLIASFIIYKETKRLAPFYLYGIITVIMIVVATTLELDGSALTIAFIVEAFAIILGSYFITKKQEVAEKSSVLMFGPIVLGLYSLESHHWRDAVLHEDFFVALAVAFASFILGYMLYTFRAEKGEGSTLGNAMMVIGTGYMYTIIWLSSHVLFDNSDAAVTVSLLIYTAVGLASYVYGKVRNAKGVGLYGSILLGFVVLRLLLVDVWDMELGQRIFTFLAIGMLLLATAFIKREKKNQPNLESHA